MRYSIPAFIVVLASLLMGCQSQADTRQNSNRDMIKMGAEVLVSNNFDILSGKNVGLITNHTAMVEDRHIADYLHESEEVNLTALFAPEHGIRGNARGRIADETDEKTGLPIYSLHGETYKPTAEMLEGVDVLVFDVQDIGPRFYTYISTMGRSMEAAAEHDIEFVVLDRPNPLGGELVEGFVREDGLQSNVGYYPIPVTHGLTVGEIAIMAKEEGMLEGADNLDLTVVEMENWRRSDLFPELGREWIFPSPNIPNFETALIYPGACFFEGTTISEGRGTFEPFILLGAPWADAKALAEELNSRNLPGLRFAPAAYTPRSVTDRGMAASPKLEGVNLQGIRYIITDMYDVRPVEAGVHILQAFYQQASEEEKDNFFREGRLERLAGTNRLYQMLVDGQTADEIIASWQNELNEYDQMRRSYFLYE